MSNAHKVTLTFSVRDTGWRTHTQRRCPSKIQAFLLSLCSPEWKQQYSGLIIERPNVCKDTRQADLTDSTCVRLHWRLLLPGLSLLSTSPCWGLTLRWWNLFFWARRWVLSLDVETIPTSKKRAAQITAKGFNNEPQHDVYVWFYHGCLLTRNESSNKSPVAATPALEKTHYVMQPKYILN